MSLFGGGKKSSTTTTVNTQNAGFSEVAGSAVAVQGSNNTITPTDFQAVGRSFDFADNVIGSVEQLGSQFAANTQKVTDSAIRGIQEANKSETRGLLTDAAFWAVAGLGMWLLAKGA